MRTLIFPILAASLLLGRPAWAGSPETLDFSYFLQRAVDLDFLPYIDSWDGQCREVTTYDRSGGNRDADGGMEKDENGIITFLDVEGPGVLCYMYSASPGGIWHFYFDGERKPRLSSKLTDLYSGSREPFVAPLVGRRQVSGHSLVPIPFAKRLRVTISKGPGDESPNDQGWGLFHHLIYRRFPSDVQVTSFSPKLNPSEKKVLERTVELASRIGTRPQWQPTETQRVKWAGGIPRDSKVTLCCLEGAGVVQEVRIRLPLDVPPAVLRSVLLRAYWDGSDKPAIDAPLGDFFGNGFVLRPYASQAMGLSEQGEFYCFFPMPFVNGMRIELLNEGLISVEGMSSTTVFRPVESLPENTARFYAQWRKELTKPMHSERMGDATIPNLNGEENYVILDTQGRGRYVGCALSVYNQHYTWWGEGDSMIFIDDDTWPPSHHGTGTEEFFNDGWGIAPGYSLLAGCIMADDRQYTHGEQVVFRHNVGDFIPFKKSLRVTVEHYHANNMENEYASTAYWYQTERPPFWPEMPTCVNRLLNRTAYDRKNQQRMAELRGRFKNDPEDLKRDKNLVFLTLLWAGAVTDPAMTKPYEGIERDVAEAYSRMERIRKAPQEQWPAMILDLFQLLDKVSEKGQLGIAGRFAK